MSKDSKIVCIGMGYLMEKLAPCYYSMLEENIATHMIAVTADEKDIGRKRKKFPFEIQLGDNLGALRKLHPNIILFAPPPKAVQTIVMEDLVPYFSECRSEGHPLPMIFAFPPSPRGDFYLKKLGMDVLVCNILPQTVLEIGGKKLVDEGMSIITFADGNLWPDKNRKILFDFFATIGNQIEIEANQVLIVLSAGVNLVTLDLVINTIKDGLYSAGQKVSENQIAEAFRYSLRERFGYNQGSDLPSKFAVAPWLYEILDNIITRYYRGLCDYCIGKGIAYDTATRFVKTFADLYLHYYMVEDRMICEKLVKCHSTKGGVGEKGEMVFQILLRDKLFHAFSNIKKETLNKDFFDFIESFAFECSKIVHIHGTRLAIESVEPFKAESQAVLFGLIARNTIAALGKEKGEQVVSNAVIAYALQRGGRQGRRAVKNSDERTMLCYSAYKEWVPGPDEMEISFPNITSTQMCWITKCPWHTAWTRFGFTDVENYYCRDIDDYLVKGFNPELKLGTGRFMSGGESRCEFVFNGFEGNPQNYAKMKKISERVNGECLKTWEFHVQDLWNAMGRVIKAVPGGEDIIRRSRDEFVILYGVRAGDVLDAADAIDFDAV